MKKIMEESVSRETLINMPSSITSRLIKEAARCENYASDLFIDYANLYIKLKSWDLKDFRSFYMFGFRDLGVDSETMINAGVREYRCMYKLTVCFVPASSPSDDKVIFTLYKLCDNDTVGQSEPLLATLSDMQLRLLWRRVGNMPIDKQGKTERDFLGFKQGTPRNEIVSWFDELHSLGVSALRFE